MCIVWSFTKNWTDRSREFIELYTLYPFQTQIPILDSLNNLILKFCFKKEEREQYS